MEAETEVGHDLNFGDDLNKLFAENGMPMRMLVLHTTLNMKVILRKALERLDGMHGIVRMRMYRPVVHGLTWDCNAISS